MTKIQQSDFEGDTITKLDRPKTYQEKFYDWQRANNEEYTKARNSCCVCTPTRAEVLLVDQYEGRCPIDL